MTIKEEFMRWHKSHPNFMTPYIKELDVVDDIVIELSKGEGFDYKPLYGVSAIKKTIDNFKVVDKINNIDSNKPFQDLDKAQYYFKKLKVRLEECKKNKCEIKTYG